MYALRNITKIAAVTAVYFGAAQVGFLLTALHGAVSLFWPPSGFALAILLLFGESLWPGIALGAFLVNAAQGQAFGFLIATACGNTLEALVGVYLLRRYVGFHIALDRTADALGLILLAAGVSTMVAATIGVFGLCLTGRAAWSEYGSLWVVWWLGDAIGILGWTPALLTWRIQGSYKVRSVQRRTEVQRPANEVPLALGPEVTLLVQPDALASGIHVRPTVRLPLLQALEPAVWLVLLVGVGLLVFQGRLIQSDFSLAFLPFPLLMWAALRLEQGASVLGSLIIATLAVLRILNEPGPFPTQSVTENLIILWLFIGITTGTSLVLAATVAERKAGEARIAQLNTELQRRAAALEAANKELDTYTVSISHELRGPISNILSLTGVILEKGASVSPPSAVELLRHIQTGARQMDQLVRDLLTFSRASHQPLKKEWLQPVELVRDVLEGLDYPRREPNTGSLEWVIGDLPACEADPTLLRQVYSNLLSNALKFTRQREAKRIEVGFQAQNGVGVYFVRDNGVGFDMKRVDQIFVPFVRLHNDLEYEGHGIGLSLAKRIVERHGGRLWAEAAPNRGATFYFTLG